jgi:hypothetical protein
MMALRAVRLAKSGADGVSIASQGYNIQGGMQRLSVQFVQPEAIQ